MKIILFLLALFLATPTLAGGDEGAYHCILKHTEFCGVWGDTQGFQVIITGDLLITGIYRHCTVTKEGHFEDGRPYSLMKCIAYPEEQVSPYEIKEIDVTGYMLSYNPEKNWKEYLVTQMFVYHDNLSENPCFSDEESERESWNEAVLMSMGHSRIPIGKN